VTDEILDHLKRMPPPPDLTGIPEKWREIFRPLSDWHRVLEGWMAGLRALPEPRETPARRPVMPEETPRTHVVAVSPDSDATRTTLDSTQGTQDTDTWEHGTSENGVDVAVVTDVKYDTTAHTLTFRTRTLHFDPQGFLVAVDAESAPVTVTTAAGCP